MVAKALGATVGAPPIGSRQRRLPFEVRNGFCNLRNFRKRCANQGQECTPWLRQGKCSQFLEQSPCRGFPPVSAGFRRVAPSSKRPLFPKDWRFPPFPPFPPLVLLSHPKGGLQQIGIDGAARAERAGAAGVLGLVEGWAFGTGHG